MRKDNLKRHIENVHHLTTDEGIFHKYKTVDLLIKTLQYMRGHRADKINPALHTDHSVIASDTQNILNKSKTNMDNVNE
jgi:hypothetical protein